MKVTVTKHGRMGFRVTLWTDNYLRSLWVDWPRLTKLSRTGSKAHQRFEEKYRSA
jgi:hypothetical protein